MLSPRVLQRTTRYNSQMPKYPLFSNPYAKYATDVDLPGLQARAGQEYHYPWVDPEAPATATVAAASRGLAPGWSILPGFKVGEEGKGQGMRQKIFRLLYDGKDTGKYTLTPEAAAELSRKIDPKTMKRRKPSWWKPKVKENGKKYPTENIEDYKELTSAQLRQLAMLGDDLAAHVEHERRSTAQANPFWVTPGGSAVHHAPTAWTGYQARHPKARLPAQAAREADLEAQAGLAPGWTMSTATMPPKSGGKAYTVYKLSYRGRDTGKFALDPRKAAEISWTVDPETGKRKRSR